MSRLLRQVERGLNIKPKPKPAEPDGLDGHMAQAIKAAVLPEVAAQVAEQLRDLPAMVREEVQATASAQLDRMARKHARTQMEDRPAVAEHLRDFTDEPLSTTYPAPPPMAKPPMPIVTMSRGADGRIKAAHVGHLTLLVERDAAGKAQRLVPQED